jgi:hypothetical protein
MTSQLVDKITRAILYEGYMLYPYRPSSVKNQHRFNFGVLSPQAYSLAQRGTEAWGMQTECLVLKRSDTTIEIKVRFLQLQMREVGRLTSPLSELKEGQEPDFHVVKSLEIDGQIFQTWQEVIEREISVPSFNLDKLVAKPQRLNFSFQEQRNMEPLRDQTGQVAGLIVRKQKPIEGTIEVITDHMGDLLYRVVVRILNMTPFEETDLKSRDDALMCSLVSTHTILSLRDGEFVSLLDPPEEFREVATACQNVGTWPVLVGENGERNLMLSSPIILYDYPEIAPESAGDLFDGTEIDEILTLRIMTLTEEEKREMRQVDERTRQILERTEKLTAKQLMNLHGTLRTHVGERQDE